MAIRYLNRRQYFGKPARRRQALLCAGAAAILVLAGCSSSDEPNDGDSSGSLSSEECVASAKAAADAGMAPMTLEPPMQLDTTSIAGKKFAIVQLTGQSELTKAEAAGMTAAFKTVGAETITYDGKGTPDVIAQAFQSAIGQKVAGIVTVGLDPSLVKSAIADAEAAGIPVVVGTSVDPDTEHLPGVVANVAVDSVHEGELQADYALAATGCDLHTAIFFTSAGPVTVNHAKGAEAEIKKLCGDACSVESIDVNAATFATKMAGQVQTTLQRNPQINYLLSTTDLFVPYIIQGQDAAGTNVPVAGAQGDTLDQAIRGGAQVVDVQWPPGEVIGWEIADTMMRALQGQAADKELPLRLVDQSNWGTSAEFEAQYPELIGYQDNFTKAWGK